MRPFEKETLLSLLSEYGISGFEQLEYRDSSHGEEDLRQQYIFDRKAVLRVNSAKVMNEERFSELNRLISRYNEFGIRAPYFLADGEGIFLHERDGFYVYLSEYMDAPITAEEDRWKNLNEERLVMIASFSEKYKNVDLSNTMSMYSLFELSPYDLLIGSDEKEQNLKSLMEELLMFGEEDLAMELEKKNGRLRQSLLGVYKNLPRAVFQGDENYFNLCVDEKGHIMGIFDFNMSGTEVIANYLANNVFLDHPYFREEQFEKHDAETLVRLLWQWHREKTEIIERHYCFEEEERRAYQSYSELVTISGFPNVRAFLRYLNGEETGKKTVEILKLLAK